MRARKRQQAVKSVIAVLKGHHTRVLKQEKLKQLYPDALAFKRALKFNPGLKSKKIRFDHDSFCVENKSLEVTADDTVRRLRARKRLFRNMKALALAQAPHTGGDFL